MFLHFSNFVNESTMNLFSMVTYNSRGFRLLNIKKPEESNSCDHYNGPLSFMKAVNRLSSCGTQFIKVSVVLCISSVNVP